MPTFNAKNIITFILLLQFSVFQLQAQSEFLKFNHSTVNDGCLKNQYSLLQGISMVLCGLEHGAELVNTMDIHLKCSG